MDNGTGKQQKPFWMTALAFVVIIGIYIAKQKGWVKPTDTTQNPAGNDSTNRTLPTRQDDNSDKNTTSGNDTTTIPPTPHAPDLMEETDGGIKKLYEDHLSDKIITATGLVVHILPDDTDTSDGSSMHQKFLVELPTGLTIKIANNIDFARVPVKNGDKIRFKGQYEWSDKGGTVHWTHKDPAHRHADGWIELNGQKYD